MQFKLARHVVFCDTSIKSKCFQNKKTASDYKKWERIRRPNSMEHKIVIRSENLTTEINACFNFVHHQFKRNVTMNIYPVCNLIQLIGNWLFLVQLFSSLQTIFSHINLSWLKIIGTMKNTSLTYWMVIACALNTTLFSLITINERRWHHNQAIYRGCHCCTSYQNKNYHTPCYVRDASVAMELSIDFNSIDAKTVAMMTSKTSFLFS